MILILGCGKALRISHSGVHLVNKDMNREPFFLFKHKVDKYFDKWYVNSKPLTNEDLKNLDTLSLLGYEIYESFMSDYVSGDTIYEYVIVSNTIRISSNNKSTLYSCLDSYIFIKSESDGYKPIDIIDFRPQIPNVKSLYYTDEYQKNFCRFSTKYGVKPYVLIASPLMFGGDRFLESSPFVSEINIYKDSYTISIEYSYGTSDFESFYKYENGKLTFIKDRYELSVD